MTNDRLSTLTFLVHVSAGRRRTSVGGQHDKALKVSVSQVPENGKANAAVIQVLAQALEIRPRLLRLITGATHRKKTFVAMDIVPAAVEMRQ